MPRESELSMIFASPKHQKTVRSNSSVRCLGPRSLAFSIAQKPRSQQVALGCEPSLSRDTQVQYEVVPGEIGSNLAVDSYLPTMNDLMENEDHLNTFVD